ncbi:MAG: hypothetical protein E6K79_09630 [Candidatus Eisenbacteria bacterium]|uniref:Uncharacterized protein n=1 Tax=Eiseniibacteriota bacterium TaxID=2212470 RepID=A0A538TJT7_UNCEI|nr:MAG: hypothetical protein E6K79_09630 [Candidatus Eisenbacteria bacterium]
MTDLSSARAGLFSPISYSFLTTDISGCRSWSRMSARPIRSASIRIARSSLSDGSVEYPVIRSYQVVMLVLEKSAPAS